MTSLIRQRASVAALLTLTAAAGLSSAQVMVGGAPMLPTRDIIDNAVNSRDHTTLVAAVRAAGLVDTLKGPGPFTVFAPTNAAFAALPAGTVETLLKPENKAMLTGILTYHVVPGKYDAAAIARMVKDGGGMASIKTVAGGTLVAKAAGGKVTVGDEKGGTATVTTADVYQSNGVIHVVDKVLMPKPGGSVARAPASGTAAMQAQAQTSGAGSQGESLAQWMVDQRKGMDGADKAMTATGGRASASSGFDAIAHGPTGMPFQGPMYNGDGPN